MQEQENRRIEVEKNFQKVDFEGYSKKYRVILADPPWFYGNDFTKVVNGTRPEDHYSVMRTHEIAAMPVKEVCEENAVLFLWVTSPLLEESFEVIKGWGFKYKTSFVWDKVGHNMGHYNSVRHEFLLVCTRGSCTPDVRKLFDSVQSIEKSKVHSQKPIEFYDIIEHLYIHGNKLEIFSWSDRDWETVF